MSRHLRAVTWLALESVWYPALMLLATPFLYHRLGDHGYGLWMLVNATVAFGQILIFGTSLAASKRVSEARARGQAELRAVCQTVLGVALTAGFLVSLSVAAASLLLGTFDEADSAAGQLVLIAAGLAMVEQIDFALGSILRGNEKFSASAKADGVGKCLQVVCSCAAVAHFGSLPALLSVYVLFGVVRIGLKFYAVRRSLGFLPMPPAFSRTSEILSVSGWGWVQGAIGGLMFITDRMLVGKLLGAAELSKFALALTLPQQANATLVAAVSYLLPRLSASLHGAQKQQLYRAARRVLALTALIIVAGGVTLALVTALRVELFALWLGKSFDPDFYTTFVSFSTAFWFLSVNAPCYFFLTASGQLKTATAIITVGGLIGACCTVVGTLADGILGASAGRLVYSLVCLTMIVPVVRIAMQNKPRISDAA